MDPILGSLLEAWASPKRGSKMGPNRRAKLLFFHWFCSIFARIRSQGAESVSCSRKAINAVAISSDNPHNQQYFVKRALTGVPMTPRCRVQKRCAYQFLMCLDAGTAKWAAKWVPRTLRITFGSNCVLNVCRIWPQTCPGLSGAHLGQIV